MKIRYLGTAAAEGFPAVFCRCKYCLAARKAGAQERRTRSQTLIEDDLLIDLPADTYFHVLQNDLELDKIRYLLITHHHSDHFYPAELGMRGDAFAHEMREEKLEVILSRPAYAFYLRETDGIMGKSVADNITLTVAEPFETLCRGEYRITALPARHMTPEDGALMFLIEKGGKTLLYAHDTGYFYDSVFTYIRERGIRFDFVSFDCTNVDLPIGDDGTHMGFPNIARVTARLEEMGAIGRDTVRFVNHFSHNVDPMQKVLEEKAAPYGLHVAFDGLAMEF